MDPALTVWIGGDRTWDILLTSAAQVRYLTDDGAATEVSDGVVGLPCVSHGYSAGDNVQVAGTQNYNGRHTVAASSTANVIAIDATYYAETFGASSTVQRLGQVDPVNLTGSTLTMTLREQEDSAVVMTVSQTTHTAATAGRTTLTITAAQSATLTPRNYWADVQWTDSTGLVTPIWKGRIAAVRRISE